MARRCVEKKVQILLALLLLLAFNLISCSNFKREQPLSLPNNISRSENFKNDLKKLAKNIKSLIITGRIKLYNEKKSTPWIKFKLWFEHGSLSSLRLKAIGPFGVTIFDMIAKGGNVWIYVGKEGKVYSGNAFFTQYGKIDVKTGLTLLEMLINPWSPSLYSDLKETKCPTYATNKLYCFSSLVLNKNFVFWYKKDLSPKRFYAKDIIDIIFNYYKGESNKLLYPNSIKFYLKKSKLHGKLKVKDVAFNRTFNKSIIFNERQFFKR